MQVWPARDAAWYPRDLPFPTSDDGLRTDSLAELKRLGIVKAIVSGNPDVVAVWRKQDPDRVVPGVVFGTDATVDELRQLAKAGQLAVLGETTFQYEGVRADDPKLEGYIALAEELDVPLAWHMGIAPPDIAHVMPYTVDAGNPMYLEGLLKKHPKLRLQVMHAGWPMIDQMIAIMFQYPNVYVDIAVIDWYLPRSEYLGYLKRLVEAGLADRIMWGSDQMMWPGAIERAIANTMAADFLTDQQRRAIFHDNAVRFFRLKP